MLLLGCGLISPLPSARHCSSASNSLHFSAYFSTYGNQRTHNIAPCFLLNLIRHVFVYISYTWECVLKLNLVNTWSILHESMPPRLLLCIKEMVHKSGSSEVLSTLVLPYLVTHGLVHLAPAGHLEDEMSFPCRSVTTSAPHSPFQAAHSHSGVHLPGVPNQPQHFQIPVTSYTY